MTGGVVSFTVIVNVDEAVLFAESLAVHVTVVTPAGKVLPDAGAHVTGTGPSTASLAVGGVNVTTAPPGPVALAVRFDGVPVIVGRVGSVTVTVNMDVAVLLAASLAVHVTVVTPTANALPETGAQVTGAVPLTASVAVGLV